MIDELSINDSAENEYGEKIVLKCGWNAVRVSIDGMEYRTNYDNAPRTREAGKGYLAFILIGYAFMALLFIPLLFDYIPCCCNCLSFKRSKIFTLRTGIICMTLTWFIASVDWVSTEHCCKNWYQDIDTNNIYDGTDCQWWISIYCLLLAAFISLFIAFYSIFVWDIQHFKEFNDEEYLRMV